MSALATTRPVAGKLEQWAAAGQIAAALRVTKSRARQRARAEKWPSRPGPKGRNGKAETEYLVPPDVQLELLNSVQALVARPDSAAAESQQTDLRPPTDEERAWISALLPLLPLRREKRPHYALAKEIAAQMTAKLGTPCSPALVLKNCDKLIDTGRVLPKQRSDKGEHFRAYDPITRERIQALVEAKYFGERLSIWRTCEALVREWPKISSADDPPSYDAVREYLNSLPEPLKIYSREGEKAFNDRCAPYIQRDHYKVAVMDCWIFDHSEHDVWVIDDLHPENFGEATRLWLTAIMDMRSRKIVGRVWCPTPSSHSIASAIRVALLSCGGAPRTVYIDNGKDFQKIGRLGLSADTEGLLARIGSTPVYCLPYHPQSKSVERFFGTLRSRFDGLWKPFYCGPSPSKRPEDCAAMLKQHELFKKGKLARSPLPPASEFVKLAAFWIEEYNAEHRHSGQAMNGRTPNQVFDEGYPPERRQPVNPRDLDVLLWDRVKRRVTEGGCVTIDKARYEPADPQAVAGLFMQIGRDVLIARDPYNLGEAVAIDDGRFIGALRSETLLAQGPQSHALVRESMRQRRQLRRGVRDYMAFLAAQSHALGVPTELEALRERAGLAMTGTDGRALPAGAAPGARLALPKRAEFDSPFVDDAAAKVIAALNESRTGLAPAFVSDAPAIDISNLELEEDE